MAQFMIVFITNFIVFFIAVIISFEKNSTKKEERVIFAKKLLFIDFIASIGLAGCLLLIEEVQFYSASFVVLGIAMIELNVLIPILLSKDGFESVSAKNMIIPVIITSLIMDTIIWFRVINY